MHLVDFITIYYDARSQERQNSLQGVDSKLQYYCFMSIVVISGEEFIDTRSRQMWIKFYMIGTLL